MNIRELISALMEVEDSDPLIQISLDGGRDSKPISLVVKLKARFCGLENLEQSYISEPMPEYVKRGKTRSQLIKELRTFENQELPVAISFDEGQTFELANSALKKTGEIYLIYCG